MILKILAPKIDADCHDTGTYPDGLFADNRIDLSRREGRRRSPHERDYAPTGSLKNCPSALPEAPASPMIACEGQHARRAGDMTLSAPAVAPIFPPRLPTSRYICWHLYRTDLLPKGGPQAFVAQPMAVIERGIVQRAHDEEVFAVQRSTIPDAALCMPMF